MIWSRMAQVGLPRQLSFQSSLKHRRLPDSCAFLASTSAPGVKAFTNIRASREPKPLPVHLLNSYSIFLSTIFPFSEFTFSAVAPNTS